MRIEDDQPDQVRQIFQRARLCFVDVNVVVALPLWSLYLTYLNTVVPNASDEIDALYQEAIRQMTQGGSDCCDAMREEYREWCAFDQALRMDKLHQ